MKPKREAPKTNSKWPLRLWSALTVVTLLVGGLFALGFAGYRVAPTDVEQLSQLLTPQRHTYDSEHIEELNVHADSTGLGHAELEVAKGDLPPLPETFVTRSEGYLTLSYPQESERKAEALFRQSRETKAALGELFGRQVLEKVEVRLARTAQEMFSLVPSTSRPPRYASGLAYSKRGLIMLTEKPRYPNAHYQLNEVFRHELAHIALHDAIGRAAVPRWFNEGIAVVSSGEAELSRVKALFTASVSGNLFSLREITDQFPGNGTRASQAYAQSADFIRFLLHSGEKHRFSSLIKRLVNGQEFEAALSDAYASSLDVLEAEWRHQLEQRFSIWPVLLGGSLVWVLAIALFFAAYIKRRRRMKFKLEQWAQQEAREELEILALRQQLALAAMKENHGKPEFSEVSSQEPKNVNPAVLSKNVARGTIQPVVGRTIPSPRVSAPVIYVDPKGERHTLH